MLASENLNEKEKGNLFILLKRKEFQSFLKTLRKTIPEGTTVIRVLQGKKRPAQFQTQQAKVGIYSCQLPIGTCHGHLPSTSTKMKSCASAAAGFQHPLKAQSLEKKWEGNIGKMDLQIIRCFQESIL